MREVEEVEQVEEVLKVPGGTVDTVCAHPDQWGLIRTGALN
ncbi:hypothetical protein ACFXKG_26130 [Streptomyces sp. NPDC059255]